MTDLPLPSPAGAGARAHEPDAHLGLQYVSYSKERQATAYIDTFYCAFFVTLLQHVREVGPALAAHPP